MATAALQKQVDSAADDHAALQNQLQALRQAEEGVRRNIAAAKLNLTSAESEMDDWKAGALREQLNAASTVRVELEHELETLRAAEGGIKAHVADARSTLARAEGSRERWESKAEAATAAIVRQQGDTTTMARQLRDVECDLAKMKAAHMDATTKRDELASTLTGLTGAVQSYHGQIMVVAKDLEAASLQLAGRQTHAKSELERLLAAAKAAEAEVEAVGARADAATARIVEAGESERAMHGQLEDMARRTVQNGEQVQVLTEESAALARDLVRLQDGVLNYRVQIDSAKSQEQQAQTDLEAKSAEMLRATAAAKAEVSRLRRALEDATSEAAALDVELIQQVQHGLGAKTGLIDARVALSEALDETAEANARREEAENTLSHCEDVTYAATAQLDEAKETQRHALDNLAARSEEDEALARRMLAAEEALAEKRAAIAQSCLLEAAADVDLRKAVEREGGLEQAIIEETETIVEKERALKDAVTARRLLDAELEAVVRSLEEKNHDMGRTNAKVIAVQERLLEGKLLLADENSRLLAHAGKLESCKAQQTAAGEKLQRAEAVLAKKIGDRDIINIQVEEMDAEKATLVAYTKALAGEIEDAKRGLDKSRKDKDTLLSQVEEASDALTSVNEELTNRQVALQQARA